MSATGDAAVTGAVDAAVTGVVVAAVTGAVLASPPPPVGAGSRGADSGLARLPARFADWALHAIALTDDQTLTVRFQAGAADWIEVTVVPRDTPGPVFQRLERVAVRYRGKLTDAGDGRRDEVRALVAGVGASVEGRLALLPPGATIADALGRVREGGRVVFSRDTLRAMLSPDIVEGVPVAGGWTLVDVYPSSHTDKSGNPLLELVLDFRRPEELRRLQFVVAKRDPARPAFAHTAHLSLSYKAAGGVEPLGGATLRALVAFALTLRDHDGLGMEFPDVLADVATAMLPAPAEAAAEPPPDMASASLNLALSAECGQACAFCSVKEVAPPVDGGDPVLAKSLADLGSSFQRGVRTLRLNGYDPLAYSRVLDVLRAATALGYRRVEVFSPCTRLAERAFAEAVVAALPAEKLFYVPLYAADGATHDRVVGRSGAYAEALRAIDHVVSLCGPAAVSVISVATRENLTALADLEAFARRRGFSFGAHMPYPSFESREDRYYTSVPRQADVVDAFARVYRTVDRRPLPLVGIAPCVSLRALAVHGVTLKRWLEVPDQPPLLPGTEYRDPKFRHGTGERASSAYAATAVPCPHAAKCVLLPACGGEILRSYIEVHGADEFRAVSLAELVAAS